MASRTAVQPAGRPSRRYAAEEVVDRSCREQYRFLDYCVQNKVELTVFTMSGATFIGIVYAYDDCTMIFGGRSEKSHKRLIQKSFISLMLPKDEINLFAEYAGMGTALQRKRKRKRGQKTVQ